MIRPTSQDGYTVVELLVVILISTAFILTISQAIGAIGTSAAESTRMNVASNLAYNNLRLYANGQKPNWFTCNASTDIKTYPGAAGQILIEETITYPSLPSPVVQKVVASAPFGCGSSGGGMPVRVQSTVTYGSPGKTMVHATYVSY